MGERIREIRRGSFGRRLPALVGALLIGLLASTTYLASAHTITVDGVAGDWLNRAPLTDNTAVVARESTDAGEYIWRDAANDQRNVFATPDNRVDITQVRYTSTPTNLNVLVKVTDLDVVNGDGAAQLQLALDLDRTTGSGALDFVAGAETQVANAARWERLIQTRLGSANGNTAIWSTAVGPPGFAGSVAGLGGTSDSIELSVPWSALGLAAAPAAFNATAALFRSGTDDTTKEAAGSDALDVVSDYGDPGTAPSTDSEVGDGTVDYFAPVHLTPLGEVRGPLVVAAFGANVTVNPDAEWIEVANATGSTINIGGYKLGDATTPGAAEAMFTFPAGTTLVAGQRFKVARSGAAFNTKFGTLPDAEFQDTSAVPNMSPFAPWSSGSLDLLDAGDEIVVLDGSNDTVDAVPYGTGTYTGVGTVAVPGPDVTLQRNSSLRDTDTVADISSAACTGDIVWTGAAGDGLWTTPGNWNLNRVPGSADHVCISNTPAPAITFNTTSTIQSVTSTETLNVSGGTLTLQNVSQPSTLDALNFTNGNIQGAGNLVVNGPTIWAQGFFGATATTVKTTFNGPVAINNGDHQLQVRELVFNGDTQWAGGRLLIGERGTLTNTAGHTFAINTDDDTQFWTGNTSVINNAGVITKQVDAVGTNDTTTLFDQGITFNNTGSVNVSSGTLDIQGGGVHTGSFTAQAAGGLAVGGAGSTVTNFNAGSSIAGAGSVRFSSGTSNVNGSYTNTGPTSVTGGTAVFGVPLNGNALSVSGGTLALNQPSAASSLSLTGGLIQGSGNLTVSGATTWSNGGFAADATTVKTIFNGPVTFNGGDHQLQVRELVLNANGTWTGARLLMGAAATLTNAAGSTFAIQTDDDTQFWFGASPTINNAGLITKADDPGSADTTTLIDNGIFFNNTGSVTVASGTLEVDGGGTSTGSFTPASGAGLAFVGGGSTVANLNLGSSIAGAGSVRFGGGTVNVNGTFTNTGPVSMTGGTAVLAPPLNNNPLTGTGGTLVLNAASSLVPTLTLAGATIQGAGNLTVSGATTWSSGGFAADTTSVKTILNGPLTMNGSDHQLQVRELDVNANASWTGARFLIGNSATVNNGAGSTFSLATDDDFQFWFGSASSFNNAGTVTKVVDANSGNGTTTTVDGSILFNNTGTTNVASGALEIVGGGTSTGAFSVPVGSLLQFSGGTSNLNAGSSVTAPGVVRFTAGTANIVGAYDVTGTTEVTGGTTNFSVTGPLDSTSAHTTKLVQTAGTVAGNDVLEITDRFTWHGGTQTDVGETRITPTATLELTSSSRTLSGKRTLANQGVMTWTVPGSWSVGGGAPSGATIRNSGTFDVRDGQSISNGGGEVQFLNVAGGLVTKLGAPGGQTANWSAEDGAADPTGNTVGSIPGWTRIDNFTVVPYGAAGFPAPADAPPGAGANFFAGGPNNAQSRINQTLDVSGSAASIDAGEFSVVLDGDLGGAGAEPDTMTVNAVFLSGAIELGRATIGPVTAADRGNVTKFLHRTATATAPVGTRTIRLEAIADRGAGGSTYNNAFADNLKLRVRSFEAFAGSTTLDIPFDNDAAAAGTGVNVAHGTLNLSSGDVNDEVGRFDVPDGGSLEFGGGTHDLTAASRVSGSGAVRVSGGVLNSDSAPYDVRLQTISGGTASLNSQSTIDVLRQSGGTLGGAGVVSLTGPGASSWTGGTMNGGGTTRVLPGVTMNLSGANVKDASGGRLTENQGTWNLAGTGDMRSGTSTFVNTGTFDLQSGAGFINNLGGTGQLNNTTGTLKKTGSGSSPISMGLDNDGSLLVQAGTLDLQNGDGGAPTSAGSYTASSTLLFSGGTHDLAASSSVSGTGIVRIGGGTVNVLGSYTPTKTELAGGTANFEAAASTTQLEQSGGTLGGAGTFTINGPAPASTWTAGTMTGTGTTRLVAGATMTLSGTSVKDANGGRLTQNLGTWNVTGTGDMRSGTSTFVNTGTFDFQSDASFLNNLGGSGQFNNTTGTLKKTGAGTSQMGMAFDNDATVQVQAGLLDVSNGDGPNSSTGSFTVPAALSFTNGTYDLAAASTITGNGTVRISGGTVNELGTYNPTKTELAGGTANFESAASTAQYDQTGGTLAGGGVFTIAGPTASSWTSGTMAGGGTTRVGPAATMNVSGVNVKDASGGRVTENQGTWNFGGTGDMRSGTSTFANSGTFDIQTDSDFINNLGGTGVLNNTGTLKKTVGLAAQATQITMSVDNTGGTIRAQTGVLTLQGGFPNYNSTNHTLTGGTYVVQDTLRFNSADVATNNARVVLDGAASRVTDNAVTPLDAFRNFATNGAAGDFSIVGGRNLFSNAARGPNLTNNGTLRGTGTYFQNVTNNGHVAAGASPGILTVDGNYTQGPGGTLDVEVAKLTGAVAGTDYDRLAVTGTATLGGTVNAVPLDGFVPTTGVGIDVVTAGTRSGVFANVISTPSPLAGNLVPEARYDLTTAKLFVVPGGGAADDTVPEAAGTKTITVTLSAPSSETATVNYATADGSAKAGQDYTAKSGTLTFGPNDTSETFEVPISSDALDETDENFVVNLSNPVNTVLTDNQASVSILDDDAAPAIVIADLTKAEGTGGTTPFNVQVSLSAPSEKQVTVQYTTTEDTATAVADFVATSGVVTFDPLETTKTVTVQVQGDSNIEFDERLFVDLTNPGNATIEKARSVVTVIDDDQGGAAPQVSISDATPISEGDSGVQDVTFHLVATPAPTGPASVAYATASGTATSGDDFNPAAGTASFVDGAADITVQVKGDNLDEATENFTVNLSSASGVALGDAQGLGTITDDDSAPVLNTEPILVLDEDPVLSVPFTLSAQDGDEDPLTFQIVNGPNHGTLTGPIGDVVRYLPDPNYNGFDVFTVRVSDGTNTDEGSYAVQISPVNDAPVASNVSRSLAEDTAETIPLPAVDVEGQALTYAVSNVTHGTVVVNSSEATFTPDANYNGPASFQFQATDSNGAASNIATASLTVTPVNDAPVADDKTLTVAEDSLEAANHVQLTGSDVEASPLTFEIVDGPSHGLLVVGAAGDVSFVPAFNFNGGDSFRYRVRDGALASAPATVSITVTPVNDAPIAQNETATTVQDTAVDIGLHATDVDGDPLGFAVSGPGPSHGTVEIDGASAQYVPAPGYTGPDSFQFVADDEHTQSAPATVNITVAAAGGGGGAVTASIGDVATSEANNQLVFTLRLSGVADGTKVQVRAVDGTATVGQDYLPMSSEFTFSSGETSHSVTVKLTDDQIDEDDESVRVVMDVTSPVDGAEVVAGPAGNGTIADDDAAPSISAGSLNVTEGDTGSQVVAVPVTLSAPSGKEIHVDYATVDGTATQPTDYAPASGTLTFRTGSIVPEVPLHVTVNGDQDVEPNEILTIGLAGAANASIAGGGTITIVNDDSLTPQPPPPPAPPAVPTADLAVTMDGPATSAVDRNVTYTVGIRNNGPSTATGVTLTDTLADGLQLVSATIGTITCAGSQTVTCPVGVLPGGGAATATIIATTTEPGVHTNTAKVSGDQADPAAANNSAFVSTRVPLPVSREPQQQNRGCTLAGTAGADVLRGTPGRDVICGYGGNDVLVGFGGNDRLLGGTGNDRLLGGPGKDLLKGGNGKDELLGGAGNDNLDGGRGPDTLYGERGNDVLLGSFGNDFLSGGLGKDRELGGPGKDRMRRDKVDTALGGPGKDQCLTTGVVSFCP